MPAHDQTAMAAIARRSGRCRAVFLAVALALAIRPKPAVAVPSFAEQTGQPGATCHVGAFGPQLKQFGRDFELNGHTASDGNRPSSPPNAT